MRKPDDSNLSPQQLDRVRKEAERVLDSSQAFGRFPTPVSDIMESAKIVIAPDDILEESFVARLRYKAAAPLKRAITKVLGLFVSKGRLVFIDRSVHLVKQTFIKLHEIGHATLPWQRDIYGVIEDCKDTLAPEIADLFEREANVFASEVLFQLDTFTREAENCEFGIKTPVRMSKRYGASIYATVRRYVSENSRACAVLVLNPPELRQGEGFVATLRRVVASPSFTEIFGALSWPNKFTPDDNIGAMIPVGGRRMSGGRGIELTDRNGDRHECIAEAFTQTYQVFILIHAVRTLTKTAVILPAAATN